MKLLIDENLSPWLARWANEQGIEARAGLADIVAHQRTGYLAKAFETEDLARGIFNATGRSTAEPLIKDCFNAGAFY